MPVIFLDIDGVLCTPLSARLDWLCRRPLDSQSFDPAALLLLRRLARRTGAEIVLSSSWRYGLESGDPLTQNILQNLFRRLERNGTPIAGSTPLLGEGKGPEVAAWLAAHPDAGAFVILDDRAGEFARTPELRARLVLTNGARGLRWRQYRQALALLE